jgi:dihydrofolate reductase
MMGKVIFGLSVSLDGFIADTHGDPSQVFAWMGKAMAQLHEVVGDTFQQTGAVIMGHRTFDQISGHEEGWVMPDGTPLPWPVVVLQSQAREPVKKGHTHYYFVTEGIEAAMAKAQELAGEKYVALHGASSVQQALQAGLLDEFHMAVAHVLLGDGVRLFDHLGAKPIHLEHLRTLETPGATHLSFRVVK